MILRQKIAGIGNRPDTAPVRIADVEGFAQQRLCALIAVCGHDFLIGIVDLRDAGSPLLRNMMDRGKHAFGAKAGDGDRQSVPRRDEAPLVRTHDRGDMAWRDQRIEADMLRSEQVSDRWPGAATGSSRYKLSGKSSASIAATGASVVSKPATKKTTGRGASSRASAITSSGEATGRMSAPRPRAASSEEGSIAAH